jgi:hypothetical protein
MHKLNSLMFEVNSDCGLYREYFCLSSAITLPYTKNPFEEQND